MEIIEEAEKSSELSEKELYNYIIWKCQIFNKKGPIAESLKLIKSIEKKVERLENTLLSVDLSLNKIEALWRLGFYEESLIEVNQLDEYLSGLQEELENGFEERKATLQIYRGLYFFLSKFDFEESLKFVNQSLALFTSLNNNYGIGWCNEILGWIYTYKTEFEIAQVYADEGLKIYEKIGNKRDIAWTNFLLGWLSFFQNNYDEAIDLVKESSEMFESFGNKQCVAHTHNFLALIHLNKGDFDLSLKHTEIGLKILETID